MLEIKKMTIRLPNGLQSRAGHIARQVARELAKFPLESNGTVDHVTVGPLAVDVGATDPNLARRGASAVCAAITAATSRRAARTGTAAAGGNAS